MNTPLRSMTTGFVLTEVLVALVVTAAGILGLSGMQTLLARNADLAAQRSEATMIASECIESLRSFKDVNEWNNLSAANCHDLDPELIRNATYTRTVTLGGANTDAKRSVNVTVSWTDRKGDGQSVSLNSFLSHTDPADSGMLAFPLPQNTVIKRPKNRNINIPIPALDLGDGSSSIQVDPHYVVVFSNESAGVIKICDPGVLNATVAQILASSCTTVEGYIVAGYVSMGDSVPDWSLIESGLGMNYGSLTRNTAGTADIKCQFGNAIPGRNDVKWYMCVIPLAAPKLWSGTMRVGGPDAFRTRSFFVCRYQYQTASLNPNERNVQPYVNVDRSIDQQNYLISEGDSASCPSKIMDVPNVSAGVLHQDCRSSNTNRATDCPLPSP